MHPLTVFPSLLTYTLAGPLLLRFVIGVLLFLFGLERRKKKYSFTSILYFVTSILLIIGLYTQIAAITGFILLRFDAWTERKVSKISNEYKILDLVLSIILISLLLTGPGFLAFDMPL